MEDLSRAYRGEKYITKKKDVGYHATKWVVFLIFVLYGATLLFPFLWMLLNSFKNGVEFIGNMFGLPQEFDGLNFIEVLEYEMPSGQTIGSMVLMSFLVTILGTTINIFFSACTAYILAKYRFPGRNVIYAVAIFTMIVPIVGTLPSQIKMMDLFFPNKSILGVLFLYSGCFGFNFILLYSAFSSVSNSYIEAASIDGAGRFKTFFGVILPQVKGSIIACSVLQAIALWNDYTTPMLFLPDDQQTLAVGLMSLQTEFDGDYPKLFASMLIAVLPILIIYMIFQKKIIESTNAGGLKG